MKKVIIMIISLSLMLVSCSNQSAEAEKTTVQPFIDEDNQNYVKAVFITYYELNEMIGDNDEKEFRKEAEKAFEQLKDIGFNSVCVQVRAFADAFYKSDYFPVSRYCFGKQGSELKFDVLKILCELADKLGFRIEAWVNPYRISFDDDVEKLSDNNIAKKWKKSKKTKSRVYVSKEGMYFNPASDEVTKLICNGVYEIAKNYDVDAVLFDDYFYPSKDKEIDKKEYEKYKDKGGKLSLSDFRRKCVSNMIKEANKAVKRANNEVLFGISPASDINNDFNNLYADVELWARDKDYCGYIVPQIYFGFKNVYQPFMFTVKKWIGISENPLHVALALYKCGKKDKYAASQDEAAINEFKQNKNIIARQINYLAKIDDIKGFYVFSYSSLFDEKCDEEVSNMTEAIQSTHP